jgi:hypothetical protein
MRFAAAGALIPSRPAARAMLPSSIASTNVSNSENSGGLIVV